MIEMDDLFKDRYVCVLGLGYVGLTLASVMSDVGFKVLGVEIRDNVISDLKKGKPHFYEPGLGDLIKRIARDRRIKFVKHIPEKSKSSVYIITVGTPLNDAGRVRLDMVESVTNEVANHLKAGDLVIVRSTMKIGTTSKIIYPILKKKNVDFDLAFCPERTLEGKALKELRELPQIVGGMTAKAALRASQIFQFLTPTVIRVSDVETAEMIKLIDNANRDVMFAYSNEVARVCDKIGISATEVIQAGKLGYPRTNLPMPGPVGGPCLIKDSHILAEGVSQFGITPEITLTARRLNENQPREVVSALAETIRKIKNFPKKPVITLLGLAFKGRPVTDDLRGTMAKPVLDHLKTEFPQGIFRAYDPVVPEKEIKNFGLPPVKSLEKALKGSNLVLILNNHPDFSSMPIEDYTRGMASPGFIYDFWNSFIGVPLPLPDHVGYMALGSHGKAILPKQKIN